MQRERGHDLVLDLVHASSAWMTMARCVLYCLLVACAATAHGYHLAAATPRPLLARTNVRAAKMLDMPVPKVAKAYTVLGSATVARAGPLRGRRGGAQAVGR